MPRAPRRVPRRALLLAAALSGLALAPPAASAQERVIDAHSSGPRSIGGFAPRTDPTVGAAIAAFGEPTSRRVESGRGCAISWEPLGLSMIFASFDLIPEGETVCSPGVGRVQFATVGGSQAEEWRTRAGLRIGHSTRTLRRLHPGAERRSASSYWLVTGRSVIGAGRRYPVLRAVVTRGRVSSFRITALAAGD